MKLLQDLLQIIGESLSIFTYILISRMFDNMSLNILENYKL